MEILNKLFGSAPRVRIMKLLLSNPDQVFSNAEISSWAKTTLVISRRELNLLNKAEFIKKKNYIKETKQKGNTKTKGKKSNGWILNSNFPYLVPLQNLLIKSGFLKPNEIISYFKKTGNLKLLIVSGVFIRDINSRADILIVGDNLSNSAMEKAVGALESEIGKELKYVVFDTPDFKYRLGIYDKLLRDILDYSHKKLINKLGI